MTPERIAEIDDYLCSIGAGGIGTELVAELNAANAQIAALKAQIPTHIYCGTCQTTEPIRTDLFKADEFNEYPWRDYCCTRCDCVVATLEHREETTDGTK